MKPTAVFLLIGLALLVALVPAQEAPDRPGRAEEPSAPREDGEDGEDGETGEDSAAVKFLQSLQFMSGPQSLLDGTLTLNLPDGFTFLNAADAIRVLTELLGNPPDAVSDTLGLIVPPKVQLAADESWAAIVSYEASGYVSDEDAAKTDYDDLMQEMKKGNAAGNEDRIAQGYPPLDLVGWALPPVYDDQLKVLYWAKELAAEKTTQHTLNYDVRVLGRKGVLSLNCIAGMNQLHDVKSHAPKIAAIGQFNEGHRYADFDSTTDKKAAYGLAGLIAGGAIAAKTGLFKGILVALLAAKKFIILGVIALIAVGKKFLGRKNP